MPPSPPIAISARAQALPAHAPLDASLAAPPDAGTPPRTGWTLPPEGGSAALAALDRGETHYTDRPGIAALRTRVAAELTAAGLPVSAAEVVITCGIEEARFVALTVLKARGPVTGATAGIAPLAAFCGAEIAPGGPVVWSTPEDPQGAPSGLLVQECAGEGVAPPPGLAAAEGIVVLGALPGAGVLRTGFLACSGLEAKALRDLKQALTICTTNLSQWIALGLMEGRDHAA